VLTGSPRGQVELSEHRAAGDDMEAFLLDSGFADSVLHVAVLDDAP